jgi:hypothetical protein
MKITDIAPYFETSRPGQPARDQAPARNRGGLALKSSQSAKK